MAPTALALILWAAQTLPPMMLPRPERTMTSPSQKMLPLTMQSVCRFSRTTMVEFSMYLENMHREARMTVLPSPRMPLTTVRSPPASTVLPASTTPPTWMFPMARTEKPLSTSP